MLAARQTQERGRVVLVDLQRLPEGLEGFRVVVLVEQQVTEGDPRRHVVLIGERRLAVEPDGVVEELGVRVAETFRGGGDRRDLARRESAARVVGVDDAAEPCMRRLRLAPVVGQPA